MSDDFEFDFEIAEKEMAEKPAPTGDTLYVDLDAERVTLYKSQGIAYEAGAEVLAKRQEYADAELSAMAIRDQERELKQKKEELEREFGKRMQAINEQLAPLSTQLFDIARKRRMLEREIQSAEQKLRDALAAIQQQEKYKQDAELFDKRSKGAFWREHAKDYQIEGARLLASANGCAILADKMGLGKTLTSQAMLDMLGVKRVLIIVPDDIVSNFLSEVSHWAPHRTAFLLGKMNRMQRDITIGIMRKQEQFTAIINYSAWRRDKSLLRKLVTLQFEAIIMDEAHSVKNVSTSAFKGCDYLVKADNACPNCGGYIQHVHDNGDIVRAANGAYLPRDFFVCVGQHAPSEKTVDFLTVPVDNACGWSQRSDIVAGTKRKYGALRSVKHVLPMTGTPILNKPQDLFALLNLIDDEHFGDQQDFLYAYCQKNLYTEKWEFRPGGLQSLTKQLASRYVARDRKTAGVVLPKQDIKIHNIEMDKELYAKQYAVMEMLTKHAMIMLSGGKKMPVIAMIALITRKRQANVWPAGIEITYEDPMSGMVSRYSVGDEVQESIKLDRIIMEPERTESGDWEGMVPDFTGMGDKINGERVVVFSQFKGPLKELERRLNLAGISCVRFDGDTPEHIRNEVKRDFDRKHLTDESDYKWQVILANYRSGGVGLNFTAATQTIILDEEWNVGKNEQAYARTDRIGQTEESSVHILRLQNTVDTWMAQLIDEKRNMVEGFETNVEMASEMLRKMQSGEMM